MTPNHLPYHRTRSTLRSDPTRQPGSISGPYRSDSAALGHVVAVLVSLSIGAPLIVWVCLTWGK